MGGRCADPQDRPRDRDLRGEQEPAPEPWRPRDSIPNFEIETGNIVGAGHSSTTGRFDDEQLFYLESRGIPNDEARRLVVHGFFVDIVRHIGVPEVEERLMKAVERELDSIAPDWGTDQ